MKLTLKALATALDLPQGTVDRWIRQGKIPVQLKEEGCVFNRSVLLKWAKAHHFSVVLLETEDGPPHAPHKKKNDETTLLASMMRGGLLLDIEGHNTETLFRRVVDTLDVLDTSLKKELIERLLQREELMSTGIGKGFAVPHPRYPMPEATPLPIVITTILKTPIDFKAIDGAPVSMLFFLLSPTIQDHLKLLSRISFCLREDHVVASLREVRDTRVLFDIIQMIDHRAESEVRR